ncbi:sporulation thiol-disulfide oxidoreductase A precursor [bacterium BMS3Bbin14]|nr:redoxin domain-containing protein [Pseudomonadota bacterium]GBE13087.1 sporulation thiol-disulfide oxidoreductase A precursor [bacterium BMS3Abin13]GBE53387.1 sporulation thiol-disulfide oxidoreductase A precursor [bacterium BMS3Bbin14]HDL98689.1 TlpA family protein disulfide reductase [Desulfobacteraceae bacterium]HDO30395.1 TlpA family protein disulfide reductase [Desulfobacteraceae bacterium]
MRKKWSYTLILALILVLPTASFAQRVGSKLKPFAATKTMAGNTINMQEMIGTKPIMLVFWASWCPNCLHEVPRINQLKKIYGKKGMEFIGINVGRNDSETRAALFIKKTGMTYPVVFDRDLKIIRQYMIIAVPTVIVADRKGIIVYRGHGIPEEQILDKAVK